MQRIKFMVQLFLKEPLWFKLLIILTFLISVIFSSFENHLYQSLSKFAAAVFFAVYGMKFRYNRSISLLFFIVAFLCIVLAISALI